MASNYRALVLTVLAAAAFGAKNLPHSRDPGNYGHALTYDYLIVGGEVSGMVLASRLSENSEKTVGVFEAGPDPSQTIRSIRPFSISTFKELDLLRTTHPHRNLSLEVLHRP